MILVPLTPTLHQEPVGKIVSLLETDPPQLSGIPKDLDTLLYWSFISSWQQNLFEQFRRGELSAAEFAKHDISPEYYTEKSINYKIHGLSGFRNGKKIIVMDTNQNLDFSDEYILELDTSLTLEEKMGADYLLSPWLRITFDYYYAGEIYTITNIGRIDPFAKLIPSPGKLIEDLKFSFRYFEDYRGTLTLGDEKYNLVADRNGNDGLHNIQFSNYGLYEEEQKDLFFPLQIDQRLLINNYFLELTAFDRRTKSLVLTKLPVPEDRSMIGGRVNMKAPNYRGKVIGRADSIQVGGAQGRYQFVHAWGTWCGPCVADHDQLIRLYQTYHGDKITFAGLAVDKNEETVNAYLEKKGMNWANVFFSRREAFKHDSFLSQQFHVNAYPTYLIIDPDGMVIARGKLDELEEVLFKIQSD